MLKNNVRSTFGATAPATTTSQVVQPTTPTRQEIGAIWQNVSKTTGQTFLNVRLKLTKQLLEEALSKATGDEVPLQFIAFGNKNHGGDNSRPTFRIFEDTKKG